MNWSRSATSITLTLWLVEIFPARVSLASPTDAPIGHPQSRDVPSSLENGVCHFDGNPDMYGLGIRIGVYIQAIATVIASFCKQKTAAELYKTAGLFQFALLIALVYETVNNKELHAVEALVTYLIGLVSIGINIDDPFGDDEKGPQNNLEKITLPSLVSILRQATVLAIDCYQLWFWFTGLDQLERTPCGTETFFLARVDVYGRFRTFAKLWSVYFVVVLTITLVLRLGRSIQSTKQAAPSELSGPRGDAARPKSDSIFWSKFWEGHQGVVDRVQDPRGSLPRTIYRAVTCLQAVMTILAVELTIRWNNIQGVDNVNSVGQLIPLIISICTFIGMISNWGKTESEI